MLTLGSINVSYHVNDHGFVCVEVQKNFHAIEILSAAMEIFSERILPI